MRWRLRRNPKEFAAVEDVYNTQIKPLIPGEMKNIQDEPCFHASSSMDQLPDRNAIYLVRRDHVLITTARQRAPDAGWHVPPDSLRQWHAGDMPFRKAGERTGATIVLDARRATKPKMQILPAAPPITVFPRRHSNSI